jgi:hypothetical protein
LRLLQIAKRLNSCQYFHSADSGIDRGLEIAADS